MSLVCFQKGDVVFLPEGFRVRKLGSSFGSYVLQQAEQAEVHSHDHGKLLLRRKGGSLWVSYQRVWRKDLKQLSLMEQLACALETG